MERLSGKVGDLAGCCQCGKRFHRFASRASLPTVNQNGVVRFSLDSSLGRLARWLRLLGHDAAWCQGDGLEAALGRAREEGRCLLTRSRELGKRGLVLPPSGGRVLVSDHLIDQLVEIAGVWPIFATADPFSRCADCNEALLPAAVEWARERVPEFVARTQTSYRTCPRCNRIFWNATHSAAIVRTFAEAARRARQEFRLDGIQDEDAGPDSSDPAPKG
jgi:uncharacterized protein with PIN domain